jgi:hypothetical protein
MKLNEEIYTKLKRYSDDIIYDDKYEATLKQWLDSYGANIRSKLDEDGNYCDLVTFGSAYAVWKMMERFRKQVVRETLDMLVEGYENDKS